MWAYNITGMVWDVYSWMVWRASGSHVRHQSFQYVKAVSEKNHWRGEELCFPCISKLSPEWRRYFFHRPKFKELESFPCSCWRDDETECLYMCLSLCIPPTSDFPSKAIAFCLGAPDPLSTASPSACEGHYHRPGAIGVHRQPGMDPPLAWGGRTRRIWECLVGIDSLSLRVPYRSEVKTMKQQGLVCLWKAGTKTKVSAGPSAFLPFNSIGRTNTKKHLRWSFGGNTGILIVYYNIVYNLSTLLIHLQKTHHLQTPGSVPSGQLVGPWPGRGVLGSPRDTRADPGREPGSERVEAGRPCHSMFS